MAYPDSLGSTYAIYISMVNVLTIDACYTNITYKLSET